MSDLGINFEDLRTAVDWSVRQLGTPRNKRIEAIRQYVGSHYAEGGTDKVVPTNFLELAITIYVQQLAAQSPQALISTKIPALKPHAKAAEIAINQIPAEIKLGDTLRRAVIEALFSFGVVKTGLCSYGHEFMGHDCGQAFADLVGVDDYFCDMSATTREAMQFEGDDYWLNIEDARDLYDGKRSSIEPDPHTIHGDAGEQRAESVSSDEGASLYREKVHLRDVWLPRNGKVLTYGIKSFKIFNIVNWDGPEDGPYHMLGFSEVPGNLLPLPPVALWRDLHELGNNLFRKLGRQADAKKTVAAFQGGNDDDVNRLQMAKDGEGIQYNGQKPESITVGGIDPATLAFFLQVKDNFAYFAGNLDTLGGLAPMTDTVGQDKLLTEAASARVNFMQGQTFGFVNSIFKSLAWYEWTDPVRKRSVDKPVKGSTIFVNQEWSEETREGDWLDYHFEIDAYSMQADSPQTKLQKIGQALERYIFPSIPLIQQQGGSIDFEELTSLISRLGNIPELNDIVRFTGTDENAPTPEGNADPALMPSNTTRTYERVNRPGATRHGKDDVLSRVLMGAGAQPAEMATLDRKVS
ncbi:hypothetical protein D4R47_04630 [archaeon]|nr:MAG: hypothetical protein D4R47_04630 [archaeon]